MVTPDRSLSLESVKAKLPVDLNQTIGVRDIDPSFNKELLFRRNEEAHRWSQIQNLATLRKEVYISPILRKS